MSPRCTPIASSAVKMQLPHEFIPTAYLNCVYSAMSTSALDTSSSTPSGLSKRNMLPERMISTARSMPSW